MAQRLEPGQIIQVRSGLHLFNSVDLGIVIARDLLTAIVENVRVCPIGSEDDHFEECFMVDVRFLGADGSYDPGAALMTFAQEGDFRPEFIDAEPKITGRRVRTYV